MSFVPLQQPPHSDIFFVSLAGLLVTHSLNNLHFFRKRKQQYFYIFFEALTWADLSSLESTVMSSSVLMYHVLLVCVHISWMLMRVVILGHIEKRDYIPVMSTIWCTLITIKIHEILHHLANYCIHVCCSHSSVIALHRMVTLFILHCVHFCSVSSWGRCCCCCCCFIHSNDLGLQTILFNIYKNDTTAMKTVKQQYWACISVIVTETTTKWL